MYSPGPLSISFLEADFCLLFLPLDGDEGKPSILFALSNSLVAFCMSLLGLVKWVVPFSSAVMLSYLLFRVIDRHRRNLEFMQNEQLWKIAQCYARILYVCILYVISSICVLACFLPVLEIPSCLCSSLVFVLLFALSYQPGMLPLDSKRESSLRNCCASSPRDELERDIMMSLFKRVIDIMEKEKPYLEHSYGLPELTADVYTNRSYLSRTVNTIAGKSIPQFINSYRVKHAVMLINTEPDLKMAEVSSLSGFNNVASFNYWFKSEMKQTPSEYLDSVRFSSQTLLSNSEERERSLLRGSS